MSYKTMIVPTRTAFQTFEALYKRASSIIKHYHNDLSIHDAQSIFNSPGKKFIHAAYRSGTHLIYLPEFTGSNEPVPYIFGWKRPLDIASGVYELIRDTLVEPSMGSKIRYSYFDGENIRRVSHSECVSIYLKAYEVMEAKIPFHMR